MYKVYHCTGPVAQVRPGGQEKLYWHPDTGCWCRGRQLGRYRRRGQYLCTAPRGSRMLQNDSFLLWSLKCLCALPHTRDMALALAHTQAMRKSILTPPVSVTGKILLSYNITQFLHFILVTLRHLEFWSHPYFLNFTDSKVLKYYEKICQNF